MRLALLTIALAGITAALQGCGREQPSAAGPGDAARGPAGAEAGKQSKSEEPPPAKDPMKEGY